jgi:RNA polymerase sigma factor (sigma-70 family)
MTHRGVEPRSTAQDDAALYAALAPELIAFAGGLVGRDDASDVLGAAFANALASRTWSRVENRRAYLYRSVLNEATALRRKATLRREREARSGMSVTWELPEFRPEVRIAVDALSVQQRAVILLTYWADLDTGSVAELLGISDGSVRRQLARARARLREVLDV